MVALPTEPPFVVRIAELDAAAGGSRSGPPVLVIPGWLGDMERFVDLGEALTGIGPVTIYEPHGFGGSRGPHQRGLYDARSYVTEIGTLLRAIGYRDREFVILGSSTGGSLALSYLVDGRGPKPLALALLSPQLSFRIPAWFQVLDRLPSTLARLAQGLILILLRLYLGISGSPDVRSIDYAVRQLRSSDDWALRRFLFEFMRPCALESRVGEVDVPVIAFAAEKDWFASHPAPELLRVPGSRLEIVGSDAHRFQEGREQEVAERLRRALAELRPTNPLAQTP